MPRRSIMLAAVAILCLTSPHALAQKRPSFAGTWIPKIEKDAKPDAGASGWTNVNIEQKDDTVKFTLVYPAVSKLAKREFTFYTDGRGETNGGAVYFFLIGNGKAASDEVKSNTTWDGDALVVVNHMKMPDTVLQAGVVSVSLDVTMRWEVSPDGKTLTRTMKQSNYSAVFRQMVQGQIKETPLPVNTSRATEQATSDTRDTYALLEEKR